jgi:hypothetical protein
MDAVMYCVSALQTFSEHGPSRRQSITFEISMLGRNGLDINDPTQKYSLKSLPGKFSGLQLVSYMYVGLKQMDPSLDAGIDLSQEYETAQKLFDSGTKNKTP